MPCYPMSTTHQQGYYGHHDMAAYCCLQLQDKTNNTAASKQVIPTADEQKRPCHHPAETSQQIHAIPHCCSSVAKE